MSVKKQIKLNNIYFYVGTIAELIKLAAVLKRFNKADIPFKVITTGQNEIKFEELKPIVGKLEGYINFPIKNREPSALKFFIWAVKTFFISIFKLREEFKNRKNVYLIVHGDTVSALLGALTGRFYGLKVVHIEAGYRSFNFLEPFPEELTRVIISYMADIHFCPDSWSLENITNNTGVKMETGENTLYETCMQALKLKTVPKVKNLPKTKYFVLVIHRQEHMLYKKDLTKMYIRALTAFASPNVKCVFVLHKLTENFLKEQKITKIIKNNPNIITIPRMPYLEFLKILAGAEFIATDGGSNQAEAYFLGKPCLLLRRYTEQKEGLGKNIILAEDKLSIIKSFLENYKKLRKGKVNLKKMPSEIIADYFLSI